MWLYLQLVYISEMWSSLSITVTKKNNKIHISNYLYMMLALVVLHLNKNEYKIVEIFYAIVTKYIDSSVKNCKSKWGDILLVLK